MKKMTRRTFYMQVSIFDGPDTVPIKGLEIIQKVRGWYEENVYDQLDLKIDHIENDVFKVEYDSESEDDDYESIEIEQRMIADLDDDGNYPVRINRGYYLIAGTVLNTSLP